MILQYFLFPTLLLLIIVSILFCPEQMWGLHHWRYISLYAKIQLSTLVFFIFLIFKYNIIQTLINKFPLNKYIFTIVIFSLSFIFFWNFKIKTTFLGDGHHFLSFIKNNSTIYHSNLIDFFIHAKFYQLILKPLNLAPYYSYAIISCFSGSIFVVTVFRLSKILSNDHATIFYFSLFVVFSGFMIIFFGYVESYSILYTLVILFITASINTLKKKTSTMPVMIYFILAFCFHQTAVFLFPSLLYVLYQQIKYENKWKSITKHIIILTVFFIILLLVFKLIGLDFSDYLHMLRDRGKGSGLFLPFLNAKYSIFSFQHITDYINEQLLISPIAILLLPFFISSNSIFKDKISVFLFLSFPLYLVFFFFMDPKIEMFRDWDLFSAPAFGYTCYVGYHLIQRKYFSSSNKAMLLTLSLLVIHSLGWLFVNNTGDYSIKRFISLVERPNRRNNNKLISHNYEQIAEYFSKVEDIENQIKYLKLAVNLNQNPRHYNNLGRIYSKLNQNNKATMYYEKALIIKPEMFEARINLAKIYYKIGQDLKAIKHLKYLEDNSKEKFSIYFMLGNLYYQSGQFDKSLDAFLIASSIEPKNPKIYNSIGAIYHNQNKFKNAIFYYKKALFFNSKYYNVFRNIILIYLRQKRYNEARKIYDLALSVGFKAGFDLEIELKKASIF